MFNELRILALLPVILAACTAGQQPSPPARTQVSTAIQNLRAGQVVDGVPCLTSDLPVQHIHVHLVILADGQPVTVPAGIGVGRPWGVDAMGFIATGGCFAWLHTHDTTGVVHVVSSEGKTLTLANLFEIWGQPLGPSSALGYRGNLAVFVNGQPGQPDPRAIELLNLENIALELGRPPRVQPAALYDFSTPHM